MIEHTNFPTFFPQLVKFPGSAQEMDPGSQWTAHAWTEEREGEECSAGSCSEIRDGRPERAAAGLRNLQPQEGWGERASLEKVH